MMRKPFAVAVLLMVPFLLVGLLGVGRALTLYENFSSKPINPSKWLGAELQLGSGSPNEATSRKIVSKHLEIDLTTYGLTTSNVGSAGTASSRLAVSNPAPITTIQADVTIKNAKVLGCAANTTSTSTGGRVAGFFFNDGTSGGSADRTGDIFVATESRSDSIAGVHVVAYYGRCTFTSCNTTETIGFHTFSTVPTFGVADTLSVQWNQSLHEFIVNVNPTGPSPETFTFSYVTPDTNPPVENLRLIGVANSPASCLGPATRPFATIQALFDNVMVNP